MRILQRTTVGLLTLLMLGVTALAQDLTDPHEIVNRNIEAIGGLERVKAELTSYSEGTLDIVGTGLTGTFKAWGQYPIFSRQEVDLTIFQQTGGNNGEFGWSVDANGKLQIPRDEATLKRLEIARKAAEYDYLDPNSETFNLTFEGIEKAGEIDCYVVKMTNSINDDYSRIFYNVSSFFMEKREDIFPDNQNHTTYSDYREVNGLWLSFKQDGISLPIGQQMVTLITLYESNAEIDPTLFEPPSEDIEDFSFDNGESAENVSFQFIESHIYLMVNIGGKERLWVLDSGAGATVIDMGFAQELRLNIEGNIKGRGVGNTVDVSFVTLPPFSIEGLHLAEQKIVTIEIASLFRKTLGFEVAGILGYDFLSRLVTRVDYANETLSFYHPDKFEYQGDGVVLDCPLMGNFFAPEVTVDGEYKGKWNFDLGAGGHSFHYPFAEEHGFQDRDGIDGVSFGAGGSLMDRRLKFKTIELAGFTIENPRIDVPLEAGEGGFAGRELIGNLGNTLFRHFVIHLDYARQQLIVEKGADFGREFPRSKAGMQTLISDSGEWEVFFVAPGTPASKAGFQKGDIIKAINGIDIKFLDGMIAMRKMFREPEGTKYKLTIVREGKEKELKLTLKELL